MIQWWQILLLTLYSAYQICDELTIVSSAGSPVFAGFITGLVMGDLTTGLFIGGSLQLFVLGVGTFGGASRIDATSGAVLATAFSVSQGIETDLAITTIAVPVAALLTYFDVLGRMTTTFFAHRIDAAIERFDYKESNVTIFLVRFHGLYLVPFQYSSPLLSVENSLQVL